MSNATRYGIVGGIMVSIAVAASFALAMAYDQSGRDTAVAQWLALGSMAFGVVALYLFFGTVDCVTDAARREKRP